MKLLLTWLLLSIILNLNDFNDNVGVLDCSPSDGVKISAGRVQKVFIALFILIGVFVAGIEAQPVAVIKYLGAFVQFFERDFPSVELRAVSGVVFDVLFAVFTVP
ncbi:MAG: hypothetical protein PHE79_11785 [Eubacteriales bacterium]|nr:hypothetical protein [Eubacteriales bacterium]